MATVYTRVRGRYALKMKASVYGGIRMARLGGRDLRGETPNAEALVVPASLTVMPELSSEEASTVRAATFEAGSQIRRLDPATFADFSSLLSICIPASVEFIASSCFISSSRYRPVGNRHSLVSGLQTLTFEPGSRLREIEANAFIGCLSLNRFCIPASVERLTGLSLPPSGECVLDVESGSDYFHRVKDFITSANHRCLVRYFGKGPKVRIGDEIEKIDDGCFRFCRTAVAVIFSPESLASSIGEQAFRRCSEIRMILVPSSVIFLGCCCFESCDSLETVSFCAGSNLEEISDAAFTGCRSLKWIVLPSSVKIIGHNCFTDCVMLQKSPIPVDSKVMRIGSMTFGCCLSLTSIFLPSTVEVVDESCFVECEGLASLVFGSPSHLRELLSLPPGLRGFMAIPDTVEILAFDGDFTDPSGLVLTFGSDSRLSAVTISSWERRAPCRTFLQVSSRTLKLFRREWEFTSGK